MGLRATVIRKYEIEYGDTCGFNYDPDTIANIVSDYCDDRYFGGGDFEYCSTEGIWEIDKVQFENMLGTLISMPMEEFEEKLRDEWASGQGDSKKYTRKYILDTFQGWLDETPKNESYIRLSWI